MNDLLLFWSNVLLVLLEVIVLVFFASVFFKKNLSRRKFGASVILLAISNITALALLDSHFWSKAFAVIIVDAIWLKIAYDDTIMQKYRNCHWVLFVRKRVGCSRPFSCFVSF